MPDQERYEADARGWLESLPVPPPRLDLDQIVATGRGQVRRRRYLTASGVTATVLAGVVAVPVTVQTWGWGAGTGPGRLPGAPPALACTITELPLPDDLPEEWFQPVWINVGAVDPTGRYVVGDPVTRYVGTDPEQAAWAESAIIRWDGDTPALLPTVGGDATAVDVNADGAVVGNSWDDGQRHGSAWIYDGRPSLLPAPAGYQSVSVAAINRAGDVVGSAYRTEVGGPAAVVVWPAADRDRPRVLASPDGRGIGGVGITDLGIVIGVFENGGGYRWDADGTGSELPFPDGAVGGWIGHVAGGWAVGEAHLPDPVGQQVAPSPSPDDTPHPASPTELPETDPQSPSPVLPSVFSSPPPEESTITVMVRWDLTRGTVAPVPGYEPGGPLRPGEAVHSAVAVSAAGDAVVTDYRDTTVVRDGLPYSLPAPVAGGAARPAAVNDDGTVFVGQVVRRAGPSPQPTDDATAVVWHCPR